MQLRTSRRRLPFPSRCWAMRERGLAALTLQLIDTSLARTVPSHHAPRYLALTSSPTVSSSSPLAGTAEASGALIPPPPHENVIPFRRPLATYDDRGPRRAPDGARGEGAAPRGMKRTVLAAQPLLTGGSIQAAALLALAEGVLPAVACESAELRRRIRDLEDEHIARFDQVPRRRRRGRAARV